MPNYLQIDCNLCKAPVSKESIGRRANDRWQGNSSDTGCSQYNLVTNPGGSGGWDAFFRNWRHISIVIIELALLSIDVNELISAASSAASINPLRPKNESANY
jgi:hypothetical protein